MKKMVLMMFTALTVTGFIFAQNNGARGENNGPGQVFERRARDMGEPVTLTGKLEWVNGRIAVKTDNKTYFISGIRELLGFVDGLKESAEVTLSGKAYNMTHIPEYSFFRTEKVTFNGKDYELYDAGFDGTRRERGRRGGA
jgi:hypothetical protein